MKYRGYTINRSQRQTAVGAQYVYVICGSDNAALETAVSIDVAKHVIDTLVKAGKWENLEEK